MFGFHGYYQAQNLSKRRAKRTSVFGKWPYRKESDASATEPKTSQKNPSRGMVRRFKEVFLFHRKREFQRVLMTLMFTAVLVALVTFWIGPWLLNLIKYVSS